MRSRMAAAAAASLCALPAAALPIESHAAGTSSVPEPATWALIFVGAVALVIRQVKRLRRVPTSTTRLP